MEHVFDVNTIEDHVGATYFRRGKNYFRTGRVLNVALEGKKIAGVVLGSDQTPYRTNLTLGGEKTIVESRCSCPMFSGCKHVAAVYLAAEAESMGPHKSALSSLAYRSHNPKTQPPKWMQEFDALTNTKKTSLDRLIVTFRITSQFSYLKNEHCLHLQVRPRLLNIATGKRGFSGIQWRHYGYNTSLSEQHELFLKRLDSTVGDGYRTTHDWAPVTDERAYYFWSIIREHRAYGVELVNMTSNKEEPVTIDERGVNLGLQLKDGNRSLKIIQNAYLEKIVLEKSHSIIIGDPPVFAAVFHETASTGNLYTAAFSLHSIRQRSHFGGCFLNFRFKFLQNLIQSSI